MAAPDPGIAAFASELPCTTRRWQGNVGNTAAFADYGFFPWKGQNIDTPNKPLPRWTSDDDTHPIP